MELPKLREFLDAFDVPWPVAGGIALGCGLILYLHDQKLRYLHALPDWADTALFVLATYGAVVILMKMLRWLGKAVQRRNQQSKRIRDINDALDSLGAEERSVIAHLVENGQQSFTTSIVDAAVAPLIQKRLIVRGEGAYAMTSWPHTVPNDVWVLIQLRRNEFT